MLLPRFSLLTFLRFLGPFFIFSEIFTSGVLYFLFTVTERASQSLSFSGHRTLSFSLKNKNKEIKNPKNWFLKAREVSNVSKISKFENFFSRSLSPEISGLRRSLKVNLFFKSRILRAGSLFFSKIWGLVLYTTVLYRTILRVSHL